MAVVLRSARRGALVRELRDLCSVQLMRFMAFDVCHLGQSDLFHLWHFSGFPVAFSSLLFFRFTKG